MLIYPRNTIFIIILCMALVTYLPRLFPILLLSRRKLPPRLKIWLSYIPVAVLASLLGPVLFLADGRLTLHPAPNPYFWAALPSLAVALLTKNMFLTILIGMAGVALLRLFAGV
ncbi:MAG: AzlD domain-containing protein [Firmicutes bacterium]|nr:AzlD domain-containing protein [Bacillota bacterium]